MVTLIAQQLMLPLDAQLSAESREEHLGRRCRTRSTTARRATRVPYVVWLDGIGWRNDKIGNDIAGMKVPWDIFWESKPWTGKVGILDDERDALSHADAARRDARGPDPGPQHRGRGDHRQGRRTTSRSSRASATSRSTSPTTRRCRRASPGCTTRGRATCVSAALYYMPKGTSPDGALVLGPRRGRRRAERPALGARELQEARARPRLPQLHARPARTPTTTSSSSSATRRRRTRSTPTRSSSRA